MVKGFLYEDHEEAMMSLALIPKLSYIHCTARIESRGKTIARGMRSGKSSRWHSQLVPGVDALMTVN